MAQFTFEFTKQKLGQCIPGNPYVQNWFDALNQLLPDYEINTPKRVAAFVAQCAHESANFRILKENLNYRAETLTRLWPRLFPPEIARDYASRPNKQEAIANRAYADRMGNGNEASGDGYRFCGRGLIQLTGKSNYSWFAASLGISVEDAAEYLQTFEGAAQSACWFWETNNLNMWADKGDIMTLTKRINGGTIGLEDRIKHYNHALHIFDSHATSSNETASETTLETVQMGSSGPTVQKLQEALGISADGSFGPGTRQALIRWQSTNGLVADGVAGPATLQKLLVNG
jgi:putative chitinase